MNENHSFVPSAVAFIGGQLKIAQMNFESKAHGRRNRESDVIFQLKSKSILLSIFGKTREWFAGA